MGFWFSCDYMRDMNVTCDYISKSNYIELDPE